MAKKRYPAAPPAGIDEPRLAGSVRQDTWIVDPVTGSWAYVKQMQRMKTGCTGFGAKPRTDVRFSLVKLGERILERDAMLIVRVEA